MVVPLLQVPLVLVDAVITIVSVAVIGTVTVIVSRSVVDAMRTRMIFWVALPGVVARMMDLAVYVDISKEVPTLAHSEVTPMDQAPWVYKK